MSRLVGERKKGTLKKSKVILNTSHLSHLTRRKIETYRREISEGLGLDTPCSYNTLQMDRCVQPVAADFLSEIQLVAD